MLGENRYVCGQDCGVCDLNTKGQASYSVTGLSVGAYTFTANYAGDVTHSGSSGLVEVTVAQPPASSLLTKAATAIGSSSASLNGSLNPGSSAGYIYFEYSTSSALTNASSVGSPYVIANSTTQSFALTAYGLASGTTYYYRMDFSDSGNGELKKGNIVSFVTLASAPKTLAATAIGSERAGGP